MFGQRHLHFAGPGFPFGGIAKLNASAVPAAIRVMQPTDLTVQNMVLPNQSNHVIKTASGHGKEYKRLMKASPRVMYDDHRWSVTNCFCLFGVRK